MATLRQLNVSTYECWVNMKTRCLNPAYVQFERYGGRGVTVCARWLSFENFIADMGPKPDGLTIERRDNDGNYEPGNCYWASRREQALNRKSSQLATVGGVTACAHEWADRLGVSYNAFHTRARRVGCEAAVLHYQKHGVRRVQGKNIKEID